MSFAAELPKVHDPHFLMRARQRDRSETIGLVAPSAAPNEPEYIRFPWDDNPDFTQELPRKWLPTRAKEAQSYSRATP
jgi:hypothetical protein